MVFEFKKLETPTARKAAEKYNGTIDIFQKELTKVDQQVLIDVIQELQDSSNYDNVKTAEDKQRFDKAFECILYIVRETTDRPHGQVMIFGDLLNENSLCIYPFFALKVKVRDELEELCKVVWGHHQVAEEYVASGVANICLLFQVDAPKSRTDKAYVVDLD